jgi:adenylosuccinate synthase
VCTGAGVAPRHINTVVGVVKAYTTRVGMGPMPTEDTGAAGAHLAEKGHEFGTTTGRQRRCGWLDLVALRYACTVNGVDRLAVTKLDVLDRCDTVPVCVAYTCDGSEHATFPSSIHALERCRPVYEKLPGWDGSRGVRRYEELPAAARNYLAYVSEHLDVPVGLVSTGAAREDTVLIDSW